MGYLIVLQTNKTISDNIHYSDNISNILYLYCAIFRLQTFLSLTTFSISVHCKIDYCTKMRNGTVTVADV